ncbi:putative universal stress protein [Pseudovibrio axinellae]|uniref:Putative universal stress protein n=1 Tax=Pseudovibrio axinellae TaxID=989403 RepID=A0A165W9F3_9HYPH|nr:universal stress protein [Pseudovibrio axinellae]KZL16249.1 putative universal stress protein [Pseudovibrio axinellae]SER79616.1 Nucleotide-binding universal stress protein, UspA family [Pseudovibrio axinellae]
MFNSILVPFDGSNGAEQALQKAVNLSIICGNVPLTLLTVYRHHSVLEGSFAVVRPDETDSLEDVMRSHAKAVAEQGKLSAVEAGCTNIRALIKSGPTARTIVAVAQEHACDLIVIGSRGLGSLEGYLLGSVSHKVTSLADCPVLVV